MTDLASLVVRMQADNSQYIKALDQAKAKLDKFSHDQENAFTQLKEQFVELGAKFAAGFAVEKIIEFTASSIEGAAAMERLSQMTGVSTEQLSVLRLAAAASGLSAEEMGTAFKKLNVSLEQAAGDASSKAGIAFKGLGINVRDANGNIKDAGTILGELAAKFQDMADGPNKVALAVALLGKQGQNLIPVLNQGAAGLEEYKKQAEAAGLVISGELAESAEEFARKASVLKASLIDGLSVRLATDLLPVLNTLIDSFGKTGSAGEALSIISSGLVTGVKLIAQVVIEVTAEFKKMGDSIGALSAIAVQVASGNFKEAATIWKQSNEDNEATTRAANAAMHDLWNAGAKDELDIISQAEVEKKRIKLAGFNLQEGEASAAALKKIEQLRDSLKEQEQAFNLGGAAAVRFKLSVGPLAEDLKKAGEEGQRAAAAAIKYAEALQTKKDDKAVESATEALVKQIQALDQGALAQENYALHSGALGEALDRLGKKGDDYRKTLLALKAQLIDEQDAKAVQALADKSDVLAGRLNKAALAAFDLQNALLKKNLEAQKDDAGAHGLEVLATERAHVDALSKINELNLQAAQINSVLAEQESKVALARSAGQITDIDAMNQQSALRAKAITDLDSIYDAEKKIAAASNDPALVDGVRKFSVQIDSLKGQMNQFSNQVRQGLEDAFAHNFSDLITGAKSFKQALVGFLQDIEKQFADMIAKQYAEKLFGAAGGDGGGGGALGGVASLLGGLFGGGGGGSAAVGPSAAAVAETSSGLGNSASELLAGLAGFASGGTIPPGGVGIVGEKGPEFAYSGSQNMNIVPMGTGKQVSVTNNFTVQAPGGTISRASQMQTAASAARSLAQANRRNNT